MPLCVQWWDQAKRMSFARNIHRAQCEVRHLYSDRTAVVSYGAVRCGAGAMVRCYGALLWYDAWLLESFFANKTSNLLSARRAH